MKKLVALVAAAALTLSLTACGSTASSAASASASSTASAASDVQTITLKVGASPAPHAEILEVVKPILAKQNINLEVIEFSDYVLPNTALSDGDLDANYFQHQPYLTQFNTENGTDIISAGSIHFEPLGIYPGKSASLDDITDGTTIAIPNDATNGARALLLLQDLGVITLLGDKGLESTVLDIDKASGKNVKITEVAAEQVANTLADVDFAIINGNFAIGAGVNDTVLASEDPQGEVAKNRANIVAVRNGDETRPEILALIAALQSEEVRTFINEKYNGSVVAVF
ncbi:MAG: MetQ/NlpA family ABC transporter substrate-binding protein [Oscillospiraceae bacterium]|nr:MetQ/NlpA family ABC transporter substrate-binding protein [Oscillospiraceae bacterium]